MCKHSFQIPSMRIYARCLRISEQVIRKIFITRDEVITTDFCQKNIVFKMDNGWRRLKLNIFHKWSSVVQDSCCTHSYTNVELACTYITTMQTCTFCKLEKVYITCFNVTQNHSITFLKAYPRVCFLLSSFAFR